MFTSFVHNLKKKFKCLRGGNISQIQQYQSASSSSWSVSALCFKADDLRAGSPMKVDWCCQPPTQSLTQQWQTDAAISLKVSPPVSPDSRWLSSSSCCCWQCCVGVDDVVLLTSQVSLLSACLSQPSPAQHTQLVTSLTNTSLINPDKNISIKHNLKIFRQLV